jgi:cell division protein FtsZ
MIHFDMPPQKSNIIKVLGFGGGGGNAVNHMYRQNIQNVDFIICNTDSKALAQSPVPNRVQLGPHLTQGLGAGAKPEIGREATLESLEEIRRMLEHNTKMAFITAGMGGGTGTGSAPIVAKVCREMGILTVGIVTTPFTWEGPKRMAQAQQGINDLKEHVDTLLVISNDKLRHQFGNLKMTEAFAKADDVLATAARCITDIINNAGHVVVDFADVCTVMRDGGVAILGNGMAAGEDRAVRAVEQAINSPLLNDNDITGAKWLLLNIASAPGDQECTMDELELIQHHIRQLTGEHTDVVFGMGYDDAMGDNLGITIIATGFRYKDPFAKPEPRKEEKKVEAPIIMTLGVEGEELKLYGKPAPVVEAVQPQIPTVEVPPPPHLMPTVEVEEPEMMVPNLFADPVPQVMEFDPMPVQAHTPDSEEPEEAPLYFELSVEAPPAPHTEVYEPHAVPAEAPTARTYHEQHEEAANQPGSAQHAFLSKPSQIYNPLTAHQPMARAIEEPATMPYMAPEPETPPPAMQEPASIDDVKLEMREVLSEEEEAVAGISLSFDESFGAPVAREQQATPPPTEDLSEEEEQKRRAQDRINRLRNLSFNPLHLDNSNEFETVPAYLRRDLDLHNAIANVEDFYSRAQVKTDENNETHISTLNNFLHGEKPD